MILLIGGTCQGKKQEAARLLSIPLEKLQEKMADGKIDLFETACERPVIDHFHSYLWRLVEADSPVELFLEQVVQAKPKVIIMDEVGYGIVPMEAKERYYREQVGFAGQYLAREAEAVYRVICAIATRIK